MEILSMNLEAASCGWKQADRKPGLESGSVTAVCGLVVTELSEPQFSHLGNEKVRLNYL